MLRFLYESLQNPGSSVNHVQYIYFTESIILFSYFYAQLLKSKSFRTLFIPVLNGQICLLLCFGLSLAMLPSKERKIMQRRSLLIFINTFRLLFHYDLLLQKESSFRNII